MSDDPAPGENELAYLDRMAHALLAEHERMDITCEAIRLLTEAQTTKLTPGELTDLQALSDELRVDAEARAYFAGKAK